MAQRHFEDALNFLQKSKDYVAQLNKTNDGQLDHVVIDIQRKVSYVN